MIIVLAERDRMINSSFLKIIIVIKENYFPYGSIVQSWTYFKAYAIQGFLSNDNVKMMHHGTIVKITQITCDSGVLFSSFGEGCYDTTSLPLPCRG